MTLLQEPELQRFVFDRVDWAFYQDVCRRLDGRHVFVTYYKGKLEVVTTSYLHERISSLLGSMIRVLAEETDTPLASAGPTTLREQAADEGVEADVSFYTVNARRMNDKRDIDLTVDPPPDLAVEVGVTRRLGERRLIYRDMGVPELWRYAADGLTFLVRRGADYERVERSPTFPQLSPQELFGFVASGLASDETPWIKEFRRRVQQVLRQASA
jgi:Uma2 family endonuclease